MTRVGLVMIVKNEEAVIERALRSALPFISTYVIVDTGSTDRTKEIIQEVMKDVSGLVVDRPWVNFGVNRSEALTLCDGQMEWAIMLDADDTLEGKVISADVWEHFEIDAFNLHIHHSTIRHQRPHIFKTGIGWRFVGAVHEGPVLPGKDDPVIYLLPESTYMETRCEGSRSKDPEKYNKDVTLLETQLLMNPTDHRTLFYLAQSYRDAGRKDDARRCYERYLDISGGWIQERYMVFVNLIVLVNDPATKISLTWRAIELCPDRLEAQFTLLNQRRQAGIPASQQYFAIAQFTANRKPSSEFLFCTPAVYEWGMDDELTVVAYDTKHYREAYEASIRSAVTVTDEGMRSRALENARAAKVAMAASTN